MTTNVINLEFSTTTKGKRLLLFGGYIYTLNKDRGKVKYWRCHDRSCTAFVHIDGNDNYKSHSGSHDNHLPSPEQIERIAYHSSTNNLPTKFRRRIFCRQIHCRKIICRHVFVENFFVDNIY